MTKEDRPGIFSWMSPGSPKKKWPEAKLKKPISIHTGGIRGRTGYGVHPGQKDPSEYKRVAWGEEIPYDRNDMPVRWWDRDFEEDTDKSNVATKWWDNENAIESDKGVLPKNWMLQQDDGKLVLDDYVFGEEKENDEDDNQEDSDTFYDTMSDLLRELGTADIEIIIKNYFSKAMGTRSIRMDTEVITKPTTRNLIMLNKVAVRLCLHDNWDAIREVYPCLSEFKFHMLDADLMYKFNYPYINTRTGVRHGVEKVSDFSNFILDFIVLECMPCVRKTSKTCRSIGGKMKEALRLCKKTGCTETRKKLLRFFIHHINKKDPEHNIDVQDMDVDYMDEKPSSAMNYENSVATVLPKHIGDNAYNTGMDVVRSNSGWRYDKSIFSNASEEVVRSIKQARNSLAEIESGVLKFYEHTEHIEDPDLIQAIQDMEEIKKDFGDISVFESSSHIKKAISGEEGVKYHLDIKDDKIVLMGISVDRVPINIDDIKEQAEKDLNVLKDDLTRGDVGKIVNLYRSKTRDRSPLNVKIEGSFYEGRWKTRYVFVVAGEKMRLSDLNNLISVQERDIKGSSQETGLNNQVRLFIEDNMKTIVNFDGITQRVGEVISSTTQSGQDMLNRLGMHRFNVDGQPDEGIDSVSFASAIAKTLQQVSDYNNLDAHDQQVGLIVLSQGTFDKNPEIVRDFSRLLGDQIAMNEKANKIVSDNKLDQLIKRSGAIFDQFERDMERVSVHVESAKEESGDMDSDYMITSGDDEKGLVISERALAKKESGESMKNALAKIRKEVNEQVQKEYAVKAHDAIDEVASNEIPGYRELMGLRDSAKKMKEEGNVNHKDVVLYEQINGFAKMVRQEVNDQIGMVDKILRIEEHRKPGIKGIFDFPLGVPAIVRASGVSDMIKAYAGITSMMDKEEATLVDKNIDAIFWGRQVDTLKEMKISSVISWCKDQKFAYEMKLHDGLLHWGSPQTESTYKHIAGFLLAIAAVNYLFWKRGLKDRSLLNEVGKIRAATKEKRMKRYLNCFNLLAGGLFVSPVMILEIFMMTLDRLGLGVDSIYDFFYPYIPAQEPEADVKVDAIKELEYQQMLEAQRSFTENIAELTRTIKELQEKINDPKVKPVEKTEARKKLTAGKNQIKRSREHLKLVTNGLELRNRTVAK